MKRAMKRAVCVLCVMLLLFALAGCVSVATEMTIDGEFSGQRVMRITFDPAAVLGGVSPSDVDQLDELVSSALPKELTCQGSISDNGTASYELKLTFSSLDEYKKKVKKLIGRDPVIEFEVDSDIYSSHVKLAEDFDSGDLLAFVGGYIEKELKDHSEDYKNITFDPDNFWKQTNMSLTIAGTAYNLSGGKIFIDQSATPVRSVSLRTVLRGDGAFDRTLTIKLSKSATEAEFDRIYEYIDGLDAVRGGIKKGEDADGASIEVTLSAQTAGQLAEMTGAVLGDEHAACAYEPYRDPNQPLSSMESFLDSVSLTAFGDGGVSLSYELVSGKGIPVSFTRVGSGVEEPLSPVKSGSSLLFTSDGETEISFRTVLQNINSAVSIDYALIIRSPENFTRRIKINMETGVNTGVLDQIKNYYLDKKAPNVNVVSVTDESQPFVEITINGTADEICAAERALFGDAGSRSLSYERTGGLFTIHPKTTLSDQYDISTLMATTGAASYTYHITSMDEILGAVVEAGGQTEPRQASKGSLSAEMTDSGAARVTASGVYTNVLAVVCVLLLIIILLALVILIALFREKIMAFLTKIGIRPPKKNTEALLPMEEEIDEDDRVPPSGPPPLPPSFEWAMPEGSELDRVLDSIDPQEEDAPEFIPEPKRVVVVEKVSPPQQTEPDPEPHTPESEQPADQPEPDAIPLFGHVDDLEGDWDDFDDPEDEPDEEVEPEEPQDAKPLYLPELDEELFSPPVTVLDFEQQRFPFEGLPPIVDSPYAFGQNYAPSPILDELLLPQRRSGVPVRKKVQLRLRKAKKVSVHKVKIRIVKK